MNKFIFYLFWVLFIVLSCASATLKRTQPSVTQGIEGHIYYISGNQMPSPGRKLPPPKGIKTTLYIYGLTNINQVKRQGQSVFYSNVNTKLITTVPSDSSGYFKVQLDPGHYSLFTKKEALFYSGIFDNYNNISPVEVHPGKMTNVRFTIDYDATY
ncbi:MAG TPA: hypothetical protein VKR32_11095 [Puia sp.]|nr:hypothetical protein [Puia sp.]